MSRTTGFLQLSRRVKIRHLRLGPAKIFRLLRWHLGQHRKQEIRELAPLENFPRSDWIITPPSISILLTVFNQSKSELENALASARIQSGTEVQILILDDGSTRQETIEFLNKLELKGNERIFREKNSGVVSARNFLIKKTFTDFIIFLDPDDALAGDLVSQAVKAMNQDRSVEVIYTNVLVRDSVKKSFEVWGTGPFDTETLSKVNMIPLSSFISTRLIKSLDGFSPDFQSGFEDWDLWYRAALSGAKSVHLPVIGYEYTKAPVSRTTIMDDNSDLIYMRSAGKDSHFPFDKKSTVQVFIFVPFLPRIGGVEKYTKSLIHDLTDAGFEVALIVTESNPLNYVDDVEAFRDSGVTVLRREDFFSDSIFLSALRTLSSKVSISINFGSPWLFLNIGAASSVFSLNVCAVFNKEISLERALAFENYIDEFWVAYEGIKYEFPLEMRERVVTVYTGTISHKAIQKPKQKLIADHFRVGFLGRLSVEKNPLLFLEVAHKSSSDESIVFSIAGEGPLQNKVEAKCAKLKNVHFEGYFSNPNAYLSNIDCLFITSDIEGIPLAAMEALSLGIPVISTDVGGMKELIVDDLRGFIWDGNPDVALKQIKSLQSRPTKTTVASMLDNKFLREECFSIILERIDWIKDKT
jgi:glycosyltransferase involved in cell wall biosynthesis